MSDDPATPAGNASQTASRPVARKLGRGLSALLGDDTVESPKPENQPTRAAQRDGLVKLPIEYISPSPLQPRRRFAEEDLDSLIESVKQRGILQPILVRPAAGEENRYEIVAGERRWRAAQFAKLHEVPVLIQDLNDVGVLEVAIVENVQRADLNPVEEAEGYRRLIDEFGHTQETLSEVVGKSRSHIANTLRLMTLPDSVRQHLAEGRLTAGHARALIGLSAAAKIADRIVKKGLSVRQAEQLAKQERIPSAERASAKPKPKDPDTIALERMLSDVLGLKVNIAFGKNGGSVSIDYRTLEQLDEIIRRLGAPARQWEE
jgi:ParB family chromosome partitioning protein